MKTVRGMDRWRGRAGVRVLAIMGLIGLGWTGTAAGQSVHGLVLYNHNDVPVTLATVRLIEPDGTVAAMGHTDASGRFQIPIPGAGEYSVHVEHLTAFDMLDGPLDLATVGNTMVLFHLVPKPIALEALEVTVEGRQLPLARAGFYQRREQGLGFFMDEGDIERRRPLRTSDLMRTIPGVQYIESNGTAGVSGYPIMSYALRSQVFNDSSPPCFPRVYVDAVVMEHGGTTFQPVGGFDQLVPTQDVAALEVYSSPVETPPQFGGPSACGVILIWTKTGLARR